MKLPVLLAAILLLAGTVLGQDTSGGCYNTKEQDRLAVLKEYKQAQGARDHYNNIEVITSGKHNEVLLIGTRVPDEWHKDKKVVERVRAWADKFRVDTFTKENQSLLCEAGFTTVVIIANRNGKLQGEDVLYTGSVTHGGLVEPHKVDSPVSPTPQQTTIVAQPGQHRTRPLG